MGLALPLMVAGSAINILFLTEQGFAFVGKMSSWGQNVYNNFYYTKPERSGSIAQFDD
jgi:hypothetical protein